MHAYKIFEKVINTITYCPFSSEMQKVAARVKKHYRDKYEEVSLQESKQIGKDAGLDQPHKERASVGLLVVGHLVKKFDVVSVCGFDNVLEPNFWQ